MIDYFVLMSFMLRVVTLIMLLSYVLPRQYREIRRPQDEFSNLRFLVFYLIIFFILASSPVLIYQGTNLVSPVSPFKDIASVANGVSSLVVGIVLVLIYNYRYDD